MIIQFKTAGNLIETLSGRLSVMENDYYEPITFPAISTRFTFLCGRP